MLFFGFFFAGCNDFSLQGNVVADEVVENEDVLEIGVILPLTGPASGLGEVLLEGINWKVEELESEGYNVEIIVEDSKSNPKDATLAYRKLVNQDGVKIIYTAQSSVGLVLKEMAELDEVLLMAVNAHPEMTKDSKYVIRHSNIATEDAKVISKKILENYNKRVGVFYQNDDWGISLYESMDRILKENGTYVHGFNVIQTSSSFKSEILKALSYDIDSTVIITIGSSSAEIIKQLRESGFEGDIYSSIGLVLTPGVFDEYLDILNGTYYHTYEVNEEFALDFYQRFGKVPSVFAVVGYSDIEFLHRAYLKVGLEPLEISNYIKSLGEITGKYETVKVSKDGDIITSTIMEKYD